MGPSGNVVCGEAPADDLAGEADDAGELGEAGADVTVTVSAAEGGVHFTEVTTLAVAVSVTEVTEVALDATGICTCRTAGCLSDTELTVHVAVPSPLAQPLVNAGFWLDGCAARATDTLAADPLFWVETCTTKAAFWPRWTLDCERWTVTHSSGWPVEFALALVLAATWAVSDAEAVAAAEVVDNDGEADPGCDGDTDPEGAPDAGPEPDADGAVFGALVGLVADTEAVEEAEGEEDGVGVGDCDDVGVGLGVGEGVPAAGSTWHVVFAFALVEVPALGVAAAGPSVLARAVPGTLASPPRVRKPPAAKLSAATRTCARRMRIALSTLLIRVMCVLYEFGGD
jgi:hypothetical protein